MKKVLITGANGYIGGYLKSVLREHFHIVSTDMADAGRRPCLDIGHGRRPASAIAYLTCDLLDRHSVASLLDKVLPDVIVHCAGTKDLFGCEKDPDMAYRINVDTTKNLIDSINGSQTRFIFLSSDYVFRGDSGMYNEQDIPDPQTVYGKTKLLCEKYIQDLPSYTICRTANVYGDGNKFLGFILDSLRNNKSIDVYNDAYFSPTYIGNLAEMITAVIANDINGILHTAGREKVSRHVFALRIAERFGLDANLIKVSSKPKESPIATDSSLNVSRSMQWLGIQSMGIEEGLGRMRG